MTHIHCPVCGGADMEAQPSNVVLFSGALPKADVYVCRNDKTRVTVEIGTNVVIRFKANGVGAWIPVQKGHDVAKKSVTTELGQTWVCGFCGQEITYFVQAMKWVHINGKFGGY